ncbi:GDSL-type esterase/lipase family protein [Opitutus terrae]|uniref:Lipolytic protein G-D-S-L family n=1 Tax=Opitutus terrae (strain DSM 11246 / JCM 15787 / PB90-1) TaxID=452637 RepID=B1ZU86_OPITP|nr:GDSL-type esterase/lipase family protein [Opitutus terrae]ACB76648.1 lipolytic protein G-D-S-L family [Opitutus terrae PB90-1]
MKSRFFLINRSLRAVRPALRPAGWLACCGLLLAPWAQAQSLSTPVARTDGNSLLAHEQLLAKARRGGVDVYFVGDSIARRWGASEALYAAFLEHWNATFRGWNAGNFAWGADGLQHILWRIENGELDGVNPDVIVILAGANNVGTAIGSDAGVAALVEGVAHLIERCRYKAPSATIILTALFPSGTLAVMPTINRINAGLAALADGQTVRFLNVNSRLTDAAGALLPGMMGDGLHPTLQGYQVWADGLTPLLTELLGPREPANDHAPPPTGDPSALRPVYSPSTSPPFVPAQSLAVPVGATSGKVVGTVQAIDPDAGEVGDWLITGGTGAGVFAVNANTGQLTVAAGPLAAGSSYTLSLSTRNGFGRSAAGTVTVRVTDQPQKVTGCGYEFAADITHPNGNVYDQVLLTGPIVTIRADPGQMVRASYLDLNDDIVQIEFAGPGELTVSLAAASAPAFPQNYRQEINYVKGHATIAIAGADEATNLSVFTVGRKTAVQQSLFLEVLYDGIADLARVIIASPTRRFGGLRTADAEYWATYGDTGISAPGVRFSGPVNLHNISAREQAVPVLVTGPIDPREVEGRTIDGCVLVAGGDMAQPGGRAIEVGDVAAIYFGGGEDSHGTPLPAQQNRASFIRQRQDVTAAVVRTQ